MMNHATTEVFFDDLRVPAENLIGEEGKGFRYILSGMNAERILIAAECIGDAKWFIEKATAYAKERMRVRPADRPEPGRAVPDRARLRADARRRADGARGGRALRGRARTAAPRPTWRSMLAADASWAAADMCVQTHGGFGFAEEFDIERKFRETRLYPVAPISTNLMLSLLSPSTCSGLPQVVSERCRFPSKASSSSRSNRRSRRRLCSCRLADAGARVIKIERPEGDFARGYDALAQRRERLFRLAQPRQGIGRARPRPRPTTRRCWRAMLAKADVFIQNLKPGAVAKLGFADRAAAARLSAADLLLDLGLRRERPLRRRARPTTC